MTYIQTPHQNHANYLARQSAVSTFAQYTIWLAYVTHVWTVRRRSRQELVKLTDEMLWDIGITRKQALAEARKPFWVA